MILPWGTRSQYEKLEQLALLRSSLRTLLAEIKVLRLKLVTFRLVDFDDAYLSQANKDLLIEVVAKEGAKTAATLLFLGRRQEYEALTYGVLRNAENQQERMADAHRQSEQISAANRKLIAEAGPYNFRHQ